MTKSSALNSVASKAWESAPATSQQRYALFKLTGDASFKTMPKLTGKMASDRIKELSAIRKPKAKAIAKTVAKAKTAKPTKAKPTPKIVGTKPSKASKKASGYIVQGDGAKAFKSDIKAIASHVKDASVSLRKSASSLSSAIDLLESFL